jgi:hypothetical protein
MSENSSQTSVTLDIPIFKVSDQHFSYPSFNGGFQLIPKSGSPMLMSMSKIPGLGDIIIERKEVKLIYKFPFDEASSWLITGNEAGVSKRAVISGIRSAFRHRYRQADNIPKIKTSSKYNDFLLSYPITSLYVDAVIYNEDENLLTLNISSAPNQILIDSLPF